MPGVARGNAADSVFSKTGSGRRNQSPLNTTTGECSSKVFVNNIGVVRQGDKVASHPKPGGTDQEPLSSYSQKVFADNKNIGRIGDQYSSDNTITSGSSNVFAG